MDIQRPASVARQKKLRRISFAIAGILVIGLVSVVLARLKPAAPHVIDHVGQVYSVSLGRPGLRHRIEHDVDDVERGLLLAGEPIGRIVGGEATKFDWQRLTADYAEQLGVEAPAWRER